MLEDKTAVGEAVEALTTAGGREHASAWTPLVLLLCAEHHTLLFFSLKKIYCMFSITI